MRAGGKQSAGLCWRSVRPMRTRPRSAVLLLGSSRPGASRKNKKRRSFYRPEERGMLHPLRAAAQLIDQKIGWNRIGLALSLVIIAVAGLVLYRILRGISAADLLDALKATEWVDVLLATLFVAAGYFTLTFYDLFALRTIGG